MRYLPITTTYQMSQLTRPRPILSTLIKHLLVVLCISMGIPLLNADSAFSVSIIKETPDSYTFDFTGSTNAFTPADAVQYRTIQWNSPSVGGTTTLLDGEATLFQTSPAATILDWGFIHQNNEVHSLIVLFNIGDSNSYVLSGTGNSVTIVKSSIPTSLAEGLDTLSISPPVTWSPSVSGTGNLTVIPELGTSLFIMIPIALLIGLGFQKRMKTTYPS